MEEAYAGDIIGVFDPGVFSIGDTLCASNEKFQFEGIPTFAPEHFCQVRQVDTMKRKQFIKRREPDCPGGRHPDIPGIQFRYGGNHCGRGGRAAV